MTWHEAYICHPTMFTLDRCITAKSAFDHLRNAAGTSGTLGERRRKRTLAVGLKSTSPRARRTSCGLCPALWPPDSSRSWPEHPSVNRHFSPPSLRTTCFWSDVRIALFGPLESRARGDGRTSPRDSCCRLVTVRRVLTGQRLITNECATKRCDHDTSKCTVVRNSA